VTKDEKQKVFWQTGLRTLIALMIASSALLFQNLQARGWPMRFLFNDSYYEPPHYKIDWLLLVVDLIICSDILILTILIFDRVKRRSRALWLIFAIPLIIILGLVAVIWLLTPKSSIIYY
jgi:hypothetical protein